MIYKYLKKLIQSGDFDKEVTQNKLDIFLASNRLTNEQYKELLEMITRE